MAGGCLWTDDLCLLALRVPGVGLLSLSISDISGPVVDAQKMDFHKREGEKRALQADDAVYRSFCVSAKVPEFLLCFTLLHLGLSPGVDGTEDTTGAGGHSSLSGRGPEQQGGWWSPLRVEPGEKPRASAASGGKGCSIQAALLGLCICISFPGSTESSTNPGALSSCLWCEMALHTGFNLDFFFLDTLRRMWVVVAPSSAIYFCTMHTLHHCPKQIQELSAENCANQVKPFVYSSK